MLNFVVRRLLYLIPVLAAVSLLTFLIVLITLSLWSFRWFERPAMNALRRRLMARASSVPQSAAALPVQVRSV